MALVLSTDKHVARKQHWCDSCGRRIEPGTTYSRQRCVDGGEAWVFKAHMHCMRAGQILWDAGICGDENSIINVCDMDPEDREIVFAADPETFRLCWPGKPEPTPHRRHE